MAEDFNPFAELEANAAEQKTFIEAMADYLDSYQPSGERVSVDDLAGMTAELEALSR